MNLKDNVNNLLNKFINTEEYAVIFKNYQKEDESIVYLPVGIVNGRLDEKDLTFTSGNIKFNHLIKGPEEYGFAFSKTLTNTVKENNFIPSIIKKKKMLKSLQNFYYIYANDENKNPVVGVQSINDCENINILYEEELLDYYINNFPTAKDIISILKKASGKLNLDINEISNFLKDNFTNENQSKQILTAIWKHINSDKSYNIFINGSEITPKKEIVKDICESANIPYYYVNSVENNKLIDIEEMLKSLLEQNNNNLEKSENTILIIDNINKLALNDLSTDAFANAQYDLAKILRGETIELIYNRLKKIYFDTSKMMIIGMGNFEDDEIKDIKINGFGSKTDKKKDNKDKYKYGMLDGLFDNFSMIIQMDEPNLLDYQNYLKRRKTAGILNNIDFFKSFNIKLNVSDEVVDMIAKEAYDNKMSLNEIRNYIENILSYSSFEIAMHPDEYEELLITKETIHDNTSYTLIRKK